MRQEWREYWYYTRVKSSSVLLSLGVALLFYLCELPDMPAEKRWTGFWIAMIYGLSIYFSMWIAYAVMWALSTQRQIKTGEVKMPGIARHLIWGVPSLTVGLLIAQHFQTVLTHESSSASTILNTFLATAFLLVMFTYYYGYKYSQEDNLRLSAANAEANLHVLKNQMQPHFLFNSLNSLSELINSHPDQATAMAQSLSDLYREILENSKSKTSSLRSELSIVEKYLELEKIRFGERLRYQITTDADTELVHLPSLLLQTLVENSLKHGIAKNIDGGEVKIQVRPSAGRYEVSVSNTAVEPLDKSALARGTGLANSRSRLELLYGKDHGFELAQTGGETRAAFTVSGAPLT